MKLWFKDLCYETKYKFLEWYVRKHESLYAYQVNERVGKIFYDGFYVANKMTKSLKALNIWKEPRKFGRFWNNEKTFCYYGILKETDEESYYIMINEYNGYESHYNNFEEITDLNELST